MKKLIYLCVFLAGVTMVNAQDLSSKDVPANVKTSLSKKFPTAKYVKWEKEHGNFEAEFKDKRQKHTVKISPAGDIVEIEQELSTANLSSEIKNYIKTNYAGKRLEDAKKYTDASGKVIYKVEVNDQDLIFDQTGKFLKVKKD